jgi:phospholipid N-methyltransferase
VTIKHDRLLFFHKFLHSPKTIGSITPSSSFLTKKMMEKIPWNQLDVIVELGAGTGVFTDYISQHKKASTKVVVIEKDSQLRSKLQDTYPTFFFGADAENLAQILKKLNIPQADCIISGLPFANFSPKLRAEIMQAVCQSLKPGGLFIAFQYSLQMKNMLKQHFRHVDICFVPLNIPPAFVYTCKEPRKNEVKANIMGNI